MSLAYVIVLNLIFASIAIGGVLYLALTAARNESRDRAASGAPSPRARRRQTPVQPRTARPIAGFAGTRQSARGTS